MRNAIEGAVFIAAWIAAMAAVIRLMEMTVKGFEKLIG